MLLVHHEPHAVLPLSLRSSKFGMYKENLLTLFYAKLSGNNRHKLYFAAIFCFMQTKALIFLLNCLPNILNEAPTEGVYIYVFDGGSFVKHGYL